MSTAIYIEMETGIEVVVETFHLLKPYARVCSVLYPSGRKYGIPESELGKFFTIVAPQEVFFAAYGNVDERPTALQKQRLIAEMFKD